jgi:hypothetical protein
MYQEYIRNNGVKEKASDRNRQPVKTKTTLFAD